MLSRGEQLLCTLVYVANEEIELNSLNNTCKSLTHLITSAKAPTSLNIISYEISAVTLFRHTSR